MSFLHLSQHLKHTFTFYVISPFVTSSKAIPRLAKCSVKLASKLLKVSQTSTVAYPPWAIQIEPIPLGLHITSGVG